MRQLIQSHHYLHVVLNGLPSAKLGALRLQSFLFQAKMKQ